MKSCEVIRALMTVQHLVVSKLVDRLGMKLNAISMRLNEGRDMTCAMLAETLRAMDYRLTAMPSDAKLPEDSYEVD